VSAQGEIESLIEAVQRNYDASPSVIARGDLLGREAFRGLATLAKHIDAISERINGIDTKAVEESTNGQGEQVALLTRATLSSLVIFAKHVDEISEKLELISQRVDATTPDLSTFNDVQAQVENLRKQMKRLMKAVKKSRK
jgi:methyl-accepting chemotaxis protein